MTIVVEEESLFQSWRETRPGFVEDGVVSEQDYRTSSPSIVVILKEVNDPDGGGWDLRQFLRNNVGRTQTWNNVVTVGGVELLVTGVVISGSTVHTTRIGG